MKLFTCLVGLLGVAVAPLMAYESFSNYTVYRLYPQDGKQLEYLQILEESGIDFWRSPDKVNRVADMMLAPGEERARILAALNEAGIKNEVMVQNVQTNIQQEQAEMRAAEIKAQFQPEFHRRGQRNEAIAGFWNTYQRYSQHAALVDALEAQNPDLVKSFELGKSYEGRSIRVMRIGIDSNDNKKVIFIEGGIHAREWASPATVTYFAQELVNQRANSDVNALLKKYDFYIVPVLNVDGYEWTFTNSRLWRKTRRPFGGCIGADPNRNFGYKWGGTGASSNPCVETFRGESAFSEFETAAERDFIVNTIGKDRVRSFLAVHSYGQYWLYPWGYAADLTPDDKELNKKAGVATAALFEKYGKKYTVGTSTNVLYAAAGGADDWAYSLGITYSYTVELRDTGSYGFQLPAAQIKPMGEETTAGFIAMFKAIMNTPGE